LGGNLGHLSHFRLPIEVALAAGHRVVLAARELHNAKLVLGDWPITYLQAPFKQRRASSSPPVFLSYTHLLAHQCCTSASDLGVYLQAWRSLFALVQPDVVLFEHSPTALIAAHGLGFKKVLIGTGFTAPVPEQAPTTPFLLFPTTPSTPEVLASLLHDDAALLTTINTALQALGAPSMDGLHTIFTQADDILAMTLPQLDHFGAKPDVRYLGVEAPHPYAAPIWPNGDGPRVFGYLNAFTCVERLLQDLQDAGVCALLFVRNLPPALKARYSGPRMRFIDHPVNLAEVACQAAWVVHCGNHSTAATFAAAGVPQLMVPLHQEQLFLALRLVSTGAGAVVFQDQSAYAAAIQAVHNNPQIREQARVLQGEIPAYRDEAVRDYVSQALGVDDAPRH
jgi:UDP:flavonoid glycosyltransferase YjiC (YdhE family)